MSGPVDRALLAAWLRAIPQSRHEPKPLESLPGGEIMGKGLAAMLQVWGAVEISAKGVRAVSQPAYYFLHSLAAWAEEPGAVITDWSQERGAAQVTGLEHGTSLVHFLERERLARNPNAAPIRSVAVAQILIIRPGSPPVFLMQWDEQAQTYQLIGGRQKSDIGWDEPIRKTAIREMEEELHGQVSYEAGDFDIEMLTAFQGPVRLSPSFGALSAYHFTFFRAFHLPPLALGPGDRWVTRAEMLAGRTHDGMSVRGDHIPLLEQRLQQPIDALPSSFKDDKSAASSAMK
ncbi:MAG: NUDIX hydrolase [Chloroflexi bacterium]|nr:NUDIX hydrolase [Chloroflexota bacterium]